jgi:hypothetical protein
MKKQVISNDEQKLNIVILTNEAFNFSVKGISKCHADDEYDKDLGIKLANTRAWIKYYTKLGKLLGQDLDCALDLSKFWQEYCVELQQQQYNAGAKLKELQAEYAEIIDKM